MIQKIPHSNAGNSNSNLYFRGKSIHTKSHHLNQVNKGSRKHVALICNECGSNQITKDQYGFFVCKSCGLVVDEPVLSEQISFNKQRFGNNIPSISKMMVEKTRIGKVPIFNMQ